MFLASSACLTENTFPFHSDCLNNQDRSADLTDNAQLGSSVCHGNQSVKDRLSSMPLCKVEKLNKLVTVLGETGPINVALCAQFSM